MNNVPDIPGGAKPLTQQELNEKYSNLNGPSWICDISKVKRNVDILNHIQQVSGVNILIALKGSSLPASWDVCRPVLSGCCASGLYEAKLAKEFGKEVHTFSPAFKEAEFAEIIELSDHIVFNSLSQFTKFNDVVKDHNKVSGLRINPECSTVTTELYNPCQPFSRFGVTKIELDKALEINPNVLDGIELLHFHALCKQNAKALELVVNSLITNFDSLLKQVSAINFGGGHTFTEPDYEVDTFVHIVKVLKGLYPNIKTFYAEPGEAILYDTGVLVGEVVDIIHNGMDIAILDISASAHLVDVLEMPYRPTIINSGMPLEKKYTYRLGGPTCLSGDYLGDFSFDYELKIGDKVVVDDQIHYSFVKSSWFNGVVSPSIAIDDGSLVIVKNFSYADFRDRLGLENTKETNENYNKF